MAWNQPGGQKNPWGRRPNEGNTGLDDAVKSWQRRLDSLFGRGGGGDGEGGGIGPLPFLIGALLLVFWLASGFYQIEPSERGIIQRFGRYVETRQPGLGWRMPWPIETLTRVNVSSVRSSEYKSRVLTADVNLVDVRLAVQYVYSDPIKVLFRVRDPETTLQEVSESAIREVIGRSQLDQILVGVTRTEVTSRAKDLIQRVLDNYGAGMRVTTVNLTDVQVPDAVVPSQRDTNKALADKERFIAEAQAYANTILPNAEGAASKQIQDATAYRAQVIAIAEGESSRFSQLAGAFAKSPEVTRKRLYFETLEAVLARSNKVLIDSKGANGNMIYLPLDKLVDRRGQSEADAAARAATMTAEPETVTVDGRNRGER